MREINLLKFIHETDFIGMPAIFAGKVDASVYNQLRREMYEFTDEYESNAQRWVYWLLNLNPKLQEIILDHVSGKNPTDRTVDVYKKGKPLIQRVSANRVDTLLRVLGGDPDNYLVLFSDE